mmetsp:Transcript_40172/g.85781  ORF Transcript_40172/g.85781 Transcript_40172/m.85781 type:complete len:119 (+) Transcript_40172:1-357(+)
MESNTLHTPKKDFQVEFNQYIWVYEDPANDSFSTPTSVVYNNHKKRTMSLPPSLSHENYAYASNLPSEKIRFRSRRNSSLVLNNTSSSSLPSSPPPESVTIGSKMNISFLVDLNNNGV